jgi:protein-export membrane protein SecD
MKKILITIILVISFWAAVPWSSIGLPQVNWKLSEYKLGLDLHGGVELDYLVDFSSMPELTTERKTQIIEDMKTILDGRVRRIGTTEPTLNTAFYGDETHIIVQIPTPNGHDKLDPIERQRKDTEFISEAKAVIGQVVKIQFREPRPETEFQDLLKKRKNVVDAINTSFTSKTIPFDAWSQKIADSYENVFALKNPELQALIGKKAIEFSDLASLFPLESIKLGQKWFTGNIPTITLGTRKGSGFVSIETLDSKPLSTTSPVTIKMLFVDNEPLRFRPALGYNNQILDEKHLINTIASPDPTTGQYVVNLVFDTEGQKMFGDITEKNTGGVIAIFLGNQLLTAPNVSGRIDGNAIITPGWERDSKSWATNLSKSINEGIVPVGIYEHSERVIGPNLGKTSLNQLILSGIIGLIVICAFLLWRYGISGIVAGASLIIYIIVLLALVRIIGVTLTLSGVAGIVLSIGIAIDSNILLLERVRDFLSQGKDMHTSLKLGFREAWSAVWDSNLTGLLVGLVLWWMGVSLVKGFGQMTVLGIIVSLLVVKHICNPLTIWLRNKMG